MSDHAILDAAIHRDLRIRTARGSDPADAAMCCITVPDEFRRVQGDYPILFRLNVERGTFSALAMFGFENGENLFLDNGQWDADYIPLAMAIQPFLIGGAPEESGKQVHIDLASSRIATNAAEGVRVFDAEGRATPYLESIAEMLGALDAGYRASADFFAALKRYELLEPLTLEITLDDGSINRLVGFHTIDEARLADLDASALAELNEGDHLMPIFMAVASVGRLNDLVARKNRRVGHG